jgi:hypothetical protein
VPGVPFLPASRPSPEGRRRGLLWLVVAALAVIAVVLAVGVLLRALPDLNPFGSETIDRTQPAVLRSIEPLSQFRAATANLEVIVDVEQDSVLPSFLKGERVLFVAAGTVDAGVDFGELRADAIEVDEDRTEVTLTLPAARLFDARVDPDRSRVFDRDRGVIDRLGSVFEDSPTEDRSLFVLSERKLRDAAAADPRLLRTAERNTRSMLEGMLRGLGFERVTIRFDDAA